MPLRPIDKSADEHGDRNEVDKDPQQILDQVALGRWPAFPPATHRLLVRLPSCPPGCSRPPRLSQPPETTAADDNAVALALLGTRDDDDLTRLRAGEATSLVLLAATALGLASRPITEPLEIPETRKAVRAEIFELNEFPQMLLRVGWAPNADPLPSTPRWPLADVVTRLDGSAYQ